jgi:hypothetical protein
MPIQLAAAIDGSSPFSTCVMKMGVYAGLCLGQAVSGFLMSATFSLLTYFASQRLYKSALKRVIYAPMSFFETTVCVIQFMGFHVDLATPSRSVVF